MKIVRGKPLLLKLEKLSYLGVIPFFDWKTLSDSNLYNLIVVWVLDHCRESFYLNLNPYSEILGFLVPGTLTVAIVNVGEIDPGQISPINFYWRLCSCPRT